MNIILNGEKKEVVSCITLAALIESEGVLEKVMAAAVNMQIVKKEEWDKKELKEGDRVELLQFVGGG